MKIKLFLAIIVSFMMFGCGFYSKVTPEEVKVAETVCEPFGGLKHIYFWSGKSDHLLCKDNTVITHWQGKRRE